MTNKGIEKYTVQQAQNIQLGQCRSAFIDQDHGTDYTTSDDNAIVAITMVQDCTFDSLVAVYPEYCFGSTGTDAVNSDAGTGDQVTNGTLFPAGLTIYGRWNGVEVHAGACILYMAS